MYAPVPRDLKTKIDRVWHKSLAYYASHSKPTWNSVCGPLRTMLFSVLELKWKAPGPTCWISQDRHSFVHHRFEGTGDNAALLAALASSVHAAQTKSIAAHWSGSGAESGIRTDMVRGAIEHLRKCGDFQGAALLLLVASGAAWPAMTRIAAGMQACNL